MQNPYIDILTPAAPFAMVRIESLLGNAVSEPLLAQVDSGADRSVVPAEWVERLGLLASGSVLVAGDESEVGEYEIYPIRLSIAQVGQTDVRVLAGAGERWVLLGRDVLNRYRVLLDGPNQRLEIT